MAEATGPVDAQTQVANAFVVTTTNDISQTLTENRNQSTIDYAGDTFGNKVQLAESTIGTFSTSDFGAIQAGLQLGMGGIEAAHRASDAAREGLREAGMVLRERAESDISKVLKPLGWTAAILFGLWLLAKAIDKKGKA